MGDEAGRTLGDGAGRETVDVGAGRTVVDGAGRVVGDETGRTVGDGVGRGTWMLEQGLTELASESLPPVEQCAPLDLSQTFHKEISSCNV